MRVLHLLARADRRGAEIFAVDLAEALQEHGHESELVAVAPHLGDGPGLDVDLLPIFSDLGALRDLRRRARSADVVLAHGSRGMVAASLATLFSKVPMVYRSIGDPTYWGSSRGRRFRVGLQLRRAHQVTALWPKAAEAITAQYGVRPDHITVIPNGVDEQHFTPPDAPARAAARSRLDIGDHQRVVLAVGAMSPEKRMILGVTATAAVPDAVLVIAGDGPDRASIEALAAELLPDRHRILGQVSDIASLYAAADVVVLLSETEGQPGVAIEAGLTGLPMVATDVGGVATIVDDGVTGILVPADPTPAQVAQALEQAIQRRQELGSAARRRCLEHFTVRRVAEQFDHVLRAAAGHA